MNRENKRKSFEKGYYKTHACNDTFTCKYCGRTVVPEGAGSSHRNHCPYCLWSLHVDINPGDRANPCRGQLRPIRTEPDPKKGFVVVHRCEKCGEIRRNKAALKGDVPDDRKLLIKLTAPEF